MRNTPDPKVAKLGRVESVSLDRIQPYWRNPRRVTDEAVNAVSASVTYYGYQQPIVVDSEYVIIAGHTRYAALRRMEVKEIPVIVATELTPAQVKQFRLIDNRSGEFSSWDFDVLAREVGEVDEGLLTQFFPEMGDAVVDGIAEGEETARKAWEDVDTLVDFVCPKCYHSWEMEVTREMIFGGVLRADEGTNE